MERLLRPYAFPRFHLIVSHRLLKINRCFRRNFSSTDGHLDIMATTSPSYERIDPELLVEEETIRGYKAEHYYPVHIGEIFNNHYQTIGKLGYGSASTVWLCRDQRVQNKYAALKVYINRSKVHRELPIYEHINSLHTDHQGRDRVRKLLEAFEVEGPHGTHVCLAHEPLSISFDEVKDGRPGGVFSADLTREMFRWVLRGLEFLHQEAHVIHTGKSKHTSPNLCCR